MTNHVHVQCAYGCSMCTLSCLVVTVLLLTYLRVAGEGMQTVLVLQLDVDWARAAPCGTHQGFAAPCSTAVANQLENTSSAATSRQALPADRW